jgi:hypothetical protein
MYLPRTRYLREVALTPTKSRQTGSTNKMIPPSVLPVVILAAVFTFVLQRIFNQLWLHPLASFKGPRIAAVTTKWKAFIECVLNQSFCHKLQELHAQYGTTM